MGEIKSLKTRVAALETKEALMQMARKVAEEVGIDGDLFVRQITAESRFDPIAVSKAGCIGLGQINPRYTTYFIAQYWPTAPPFADRPLPGWTDKELRELLKSPEFNLRLAARIMRGYLETYKTWERALVAYNAGPGKLHAIVNRHSAAWMANLPAETKKYLQAILLQ